MYQAVGGRGFHESTGQIVRPIRDPPPKEPTLCRCHAPTEQPLQDRGPPDVLRSLPDRWRGKRGWSRRAFPITSRSMATTAKPFSFRMRTGTHRGDGGAPGLPPVSAAVRTALAAEGRQSDGRSTKQPTGTCEEFARTGKIALTTQDLRRTNSAKRRLLHTFLSPIFPSPRPFAEPCLAEETGVRAVVVECGR